MFVGHQRQFAFAMHGNAVGKLQFLRRKPLGQVCDFGRTLRIVGQRARRSLLDGSALQQASHRVQGSRGGGASLLHVPGHLHHAGPVAGAQRQQQVHTGLPVTGTEHRGHRLLRQLPATVGYGLIGQGQGVAHRTPCRLGQQAQRAALRRNVLAGQHLGEVFLHHVRCHRPQIELKTPAEHGRQHALRVGRGEHELQVLGRLLQRLQQRVESILGELVGLIDHEDLVATQRWLVGGPLDQVSNLVNAAVGGRIELDVVNVAVGVDVGAGCAHAAGAGGDTASPVRPRAVQTLGQYAGNGGLADAAGTGEEVGVVKPTLVQGIRQRTNHMILARHLREVSRAVFPRQHDI